MLNYNIVEMESKTDLSNVILLIHRKQVGEQMDVQMLVQLIIDQVQAQVVLQVQVRVQVHLVEALQVRQEVQVQVRLVEVLQVRQEVQAHLVEDLQVEGQVLQEDDQAHEERLQAHEVLLVIVVIKLYKEIEEKNVKCDQTVFSHHTVLQQLVSMIHIQFQQNEV
jgi:hypothetical protein